MITSVTAGPYDVRGVSVGGVYTSLHVPQLGALLDVGMPPRSFAGVDQLFLSHGHVDHIGGLASLLGLRALIRKPEPLRVFLPAEIRDDVREAVTAAERLQRRDLAVELVPLSPGDEAPLRADLHVRALRTYHPVPSIGFEFFRRVAKLRPEHADLPGDEIARRRREGTGDELFTTREHVELAYATDTLSRVLDREPSILRARVLVLECTFLDERKAVSVAREGCHIHLDELLERADRFENEALVLMHFSQIYKPREVREILARRCPPALRDRIVVFAPAAGDWPG